MRKKPLNIGDTVKLISNINPFWESILYSVYNISRGVIYTVTGINVEEGRFVLINGKFLREDLFQKTVAVGFLIDGDEDDNP